jgi:hypothetical protein
VPTQTGTDTGTPEATGDTESTGDTASSTADTATSGVLLSASCALTPDNALRAWCDVTVAPPSGVLITFTRSTPSRIMASWVASMHTVLLPSTETGSS